MALLLAMAAIVVGCERPSDRAESSPVAASPEVTPARRTADFGGVDVSRDARLVADWAVGSNDHGARPFAIIDKVRASVLVFDGDGRLTGASPALLGSARGDDTAPGVGDKPIDAVLPHERTTPAGRFVVERGVNAKGRPVIWIDYDAAVSIHAVVRGTPKEQRAERLSSEEAEDNRISYGCVNLPPAFFETVALPAFTNPDGIIYVLPETRPLATVFPGLSSAPKPAQVVLRQRSEKNGISTE